MNEFEKLMTLAKQRREAGRPCNPMRNPRDDVDWLTRAEIERVQVLMLKASIAARLASNEPQMNPMAKFA